MSYDGLERLLERNLVQGFLVNKNTPKPDCITCTEAKLARKPYKNMEKRNTVIGELMHIDVWGKDNITSIGGYQYFVFFVDDAARYVTVNLQKKKDKATQKVKNYLTYLRTHGMWLKGIKID